MINKKSIAIALFICVLNSFGNRYYDNRAGVWFSRDKQKEFWTPYAYSQSPLIEVDPDGEKTLWLGGAGDQENTAKYSIPFVKKMNKAGINDASWMKTPRESMREVRALFTFINSPRLFLSSAKLISKQYIRPEGQQFNLVGYSYGASEALYSALYLANNGKYVDNVVLIGSPIPKSSIIVKAAERNSNIGKITWIEIDGDLLTGQGTDPSKHFFYTTNEIGQQDQLINLLKNSGVK